MNYAIQAKSLSKSFGDIKSVDEATFQVEESEIFGFLGSNGAGKSTTMMILTTLLKPTSGAATVAGYDVVSQPSQVRKNIGFVQQESAVDEYLTGRENLLLQARLSRIDLSLARKDIDLMLETTGLTDRQHDAVVTYSGGMKRRLDIACGLLHRPKVLFLDEPTIGLDIQTRHRIWRQIRQMHREYDMTIFLTTHYMEEADELCDHIGIIDHGKVKAVGVPTDMKDDIGTDTVRMTIQGDPARIMGGISGMVGVESVSASGSIITVHVHGGASITPAIFALASRLHVDILSVSMSRPTLDEVYMSYTGRQIQDERR